MILAKYTLWLLSAGLGFGVVWLFAQARETTQRQDHRRRTLHGEVALALASVALLVALALQWNGDRRHVQELADSQAKTDLAEQRITQVLDATTKVLALVNATPLPSLTSNEAERAKEIFNDPTIGVLMKSGEFQNFRGRYLTSTLREGGSGEPPCASKDANGSGCASGEAAITFAANVTPTASAAASATCINEAKQYLSSLTSVLSPDSGQGALSLTEIVNTMHRNGTGGTLPPLPLDGCTGLLVRVPPAARISRIQLTVSSDSGPGVCREFVIDADVLAPTWCVPNDKALSSDYFLGARYEAPRVDGPIASVIFSNGTSGRLTPRLRVYYR